MFDIMKYDTKFNGELGWIVEETKFDTNFLGKCEAIMNLGNGYMGIRSTTEEKYLGEVRNTFISGTFNKFDENEVTELPNIADLINIDIIVNGQILDITRGTLEQYSRKLNIRTGELTRRFIWTNLSGLKLEMNFKRFVSLDNKHIIGQKVEIKPLNEDVELTIKSGIDAQVTNTGVQHFSEGEKRLYDKIYMQTVQTTTQTNIDVVLNTAHKLNINGKKCEYKDFIEMDRRKILHKYDVKIFKNDIFTLEKISNIYTSIDKEVEGTNIEELKILSRKELEKAYLLGYEALFENSVKAWKNVWDNYDIKIVSNDIYDQLAIRFAHYHLTVFTPAHDNRMNIGAKGLSGEGYKGHTFWDTEIFILPFFSYTNPKVARSLLEYRYLSLKGAHNKAKDNGYEGAMFPWESAWLDDGEVTPVWGGADIVTGERTKIWSGFIEQHVTSDIAFATWQYYKITGDQDFMDKYGYELLLDTAKFWQSRLEWNEEKAEYHINDVVGPDEYKEHVNNNAFTNYTAYWNIKIAMEYYNILKEEKTDIFAKLNEKIGLDEVYIKWSQKVDKIFLPKPNDKLIVPQDDTYLQKKNIDLTKYKNQQNVGSLFKDYSLEQVNEMQISKQADIMVLFYLFEDLFDKDTKIANWNYYEPRTLHDSSLSLSTHSVLASDLGEGELAYKLFKKATQIDLGPNMKTSDHGIHAASIGGIWQCIVNGFGGVRMVGGNLRIEPKMPADWNKFEFPINWQGEKLLITVEEDKFTVKNISKNKNLEFINNDKKYIVGDEIIVKQ